MPNGVARACPKRGGTEKNRSAFEAQMRALECAFRLSKPDARERAKRLHAKAMATADRLAEACGFAAERAAQYRAEGADSAALVEDRRVSGLAESLGYYEAQAETIAEVLKRYRGHVPAREDRGPTADRAAKRLLTDGITRLYQDGQIDDVQMRAAREIARIYEATTIDVRARTVCGAPIDRRARATLKDAMPLALAELRSRRYLPWLASMRERGDIDMDVVLGVVVDGLSLEAVRRRHRIGWRRARRMVNEALTAYSALLHQRQDR